MSEQAAVARRLRARQVERDEVGRVQRRAGLCQRDRAGGEVRGDRREHVAAVKRR